MESIKVHGKPINGSRLSAFLHQIADSISPNANIICGIEQTNPYETLCSFSFDGGVLNLSMFDMKGGAL